MAKIKKVFNCTECGHAVARWLGKCPQCESWNSFKESSEHSNNTGSIVKALGNSVPIMLADVLETEMDRFKTGMQELDRVLGGGLVKGSLTLLGGEPGIGKSTLLMEACGRLSDKYPDKKLLYVSGEESPAQIAARCKRLGINSENLYILNESNLQAILEVERSLMPSFLVLDSIQTTFSSDVQSAAGTASQVREVTQELMNHAKGKNITSMIIGHVTKEGSIAGPKLLEHMVDTVVYFEGDGGYQHRVLRAIKNRFGNTNEVGIFEMAENGLSEVHNPSMCFTGSQNNCQGRTLTCVLEGSRPLLVEVQALTVENKFGNARRTTQGLESNRLAMLVAIADKHLKIPLSLNDIYINIVGGFRLNSRESDLAVLASLVSSYYARPIDDGTIFLGEVGLTGEVRAIPGLERRLKEIENLGFGKVVLPAGEKNRLKGKFRLQLMGVQRAAEIVDMI